MVQFDKRGAYLLILLFIVGLLTSLLFNFAINAISPADKIIIFDVSEDSNAARAGLEVNDIIYKVNGEDLSSVQSLDRIEEIISNSKNLDEPITFELSNNNIVTFKFEEKPTIMYGRSSQIESNTYSILGSIIGIVTIFFSGYLFSWFYNKYKYTRFDKEDILNISFTCAIIPSALALILLIILKITTLFSSAVIVNLLGSWFVLLFFIVAVIGFAINFVLNYTSLSLYNKIN
jgi:hypothetical protein